MKAYIYSGSTPYNPNDKSKWTRYPGSVEDCIREHAGTKTFQIQWEVDDMIYSITISSLDDKKSYFKEIAWEVLQGLKEQMQKQ